MSNYPDSVNPGDQNAPWNQPEPELTLYVVTADFLIEATDPEDAKQRFAADGDLECVVKVEEW